MSSRNECTSTVACLIRRPPFFKNRRSAVGELCPCFAARFSRPNRPAPQGRDEETIKALWQMPQSWETMRKEFSQPRYLARAGQATSADTRNDLETSIAQLCHLGQLGGRSHARAEMPAQENRDPPISQGCERVQLSKCSMADGCQSLL